MISNIIFDISEGSVQRISGTNGIGTWLVEWIYGTRIYVLKTLEGLLKIKLFLCALATI